MRKIICCVVATLLGTVAASAQPPSAAHAPSSDAAANATCDRACLIGFAQRYMDALSHKDPSRAALARDVKFTENDVLMPIGEGIWNTISSVSANALTIADTQNNNAAWFGTVEEHGAPAFYAMRVKVRDGRISEVETVVHRNTGMPAPFGDTAKLVHDPAFNQVLAPQERRGRERLRDVVNGYFSTVSRNDGDVLTLFDPDCQRTENGISTTSGSYGSAALAQGCEAQFKLGYFNINKRIRQRYFPLIDTERGVVVSTGFFDHDNNYDSYQTTDGKTHATLLKFPNSLTYIEAFKIRNGRIYRIESVFTYVPYYMHSPWPNPEDESEE